MTKQELMVEMEGRISGSRGDRRGTLEAALQSIDHGAYTEARFFLVEGFCFDEADLLNEYVDGHDCSGFVPGWN